jgi:hypothetical protein
MKMRVSITGLLLFSLSVHSQSDPGAYLAAVDRELTTVQEASWQYAKAATQNNLQKMEKRRHMLLGAVTIAISNISAMPPFDSSTSLRDSALLFLAIRQAVLQEDFGRVVDLEPVADQAFDPMEAFLKARDLSEKRLERAGNAVEKEYVTFAGRYNIKAVRAENVLSQNLEAAAASHDHFRKIYRIFFDNYKQESYFLGAIMQHDVSGMEQNRSALLKSAEEGLRRLRSIPGFREDAQLRSACAKLLTFYRHEASSALERAPEFFVEKENLAKMHDARLLKKGEGDNPEGDQAYQKALKRYHRHYLEFSETCQALEKKRKDLLALWNHAAESFLGRNMP